MAVVRNLMIRIGADYSSARKTMQNATRDLGKFKNDATRATSTIKGNSGLGGISTEFKTLGSTVSSALSRIRGAKGIGGIVSELHSLRPVMGTATKGLGLLGGAAAGAGGAFGGAALGVGAFVAVLGVATVGIYKASQAAVRFEADIGRLNISLREGSRSYMDWARAQGLAKQSAAELGATYGNLLGSFISDTRQLTQSTQDLVHATRVISSYTGRSLDDVFNRIRSGMLGSTEAIEDLGVYVNISMIESTNAFRKFAGDKSWAQLTFQQQQQIRLAAILEQTYKRYGTNLQANVMTKQERMLEQFKDVKLNLSQAFLPIWDVVLPALTDLAESLAYVTEQLARFTYWLRGWDYDEATRGTDRQTDAIDDLDDSLQDTEKSAKKAYKALAAFDQLNLIGDTGGAGGGVSGGSGGSGGGGFPGGGSGGRDNDFPFYPPLNNRRWRIEFDPPRPPDAGAGAVATAVISTINSMVAEAKLKIAQMWAEFQLQSQQGTMGQLATWSSFVGAVTRNIIPTMATSAQMQWDAMWEQLQLRANAGSTALRLTWNNLWTQMQAKAATTSASIQAQVAGMGARLVEGIKATGTQVRTGWQSMLTGMLTGLIASRANISAEWTKLKTDIASIQNPITTVKEVWNGALTEMENRLSTARTTFQWSLGLVSVSLQNLIPDLNDLRTTWSQTMESMQSAAISQLSKVVTKIAEVRSAWNDLKTTVSQSVETASSNATSAVAKVGTPLLVGALKTADWLGSESGNTGKSKGQVMGDIISSKAHVPLEWAAGVATGSGLLNTGKAALGSAAKWLENLFKGVPAFATGGIVSGPTLAMVGEYAGAIGNPEVIAPLSELEDMIDSGEQVGVLRQILQAIQAGQNVTVTISESEVAQAAINGHNKVARRSGQTPLIL